MTGAVLAQLRGQGPVAAGAVGVVVGAYVAVQEYGQRVRHALDCARELAGAVDRQLTWTLAVTVPTLPVRGPLRELVVGGESAAARAVRADGTVEFPPDTGPVRTAQDAAALAESVGAGSGSAARAGFDQVAARLGVPGSPDPTSPLELIDDGQPPGRRERTPAGPARPGR